MLRETAGNGGPVPDAAVPHSADGGGPKSFARRSPGPTSASPSPLKEACSLTTPPNHPERLHRGRFPKGQSGNPTGRPRGIKERVSRGVIKTLVLEVIESNEPKVRAALERAATNPKSVVQ